MSQAPRRRDARKQRRPQLVARAKTPSARRAHVAAGGRITGRSFRSFRFGQSRFFFGFFFSPSAGAFFFFFCVDTETLSWAFAAARRWRCRRESIEGGSNVDAGAGPSSAF